MTSRQALRVETDWILDAVSVRSHLAVTDEAGRQVPVRFSPSPDGQAALIELTQLPQARFLTLRAH